MKTKKRGSLKNISNNQFLSNKKLIKKYGLYKDTDKDKKINKYDCYPFNKKRQDVPVPVYDASSQYLGTTRPESTIPSYYINTGGTPAGYTRTSGGGLVSTPGTPAQPGISNYWGGGSSRGANPYGMGTPEYHLWNEQREQAQEARRLEALERARVEAERQRREQEQRRLEIEAKNRKAIELAQQYKRSLSQQELTNIYGEDYIKEQRSFFQANLPATSRVYGGLVESGEKVYSPSAKTEEQLEQPQTAEFFRTPGINPKIYITEGNETRLATQTDYSKYGTTRENLIRSMPGELIAGEKPGGIKGLVYDVQTMPVYQTLESTYQTTRENIDTSISENPIFSTGRNVFRKSEEILFLPFTSVQRLGQRGVDYLYPKGVAGQIGAGVIELGTGLLPTKTTDVLIYGGLGKLYSKFPKISSGAFFGIGAYQTATATDIKGATKGVVLSAVGGYGLLKGYKPYFKGMKDKFSVSPSLESTYTTPGTIKATIPRAKGYAEFDILKPSRLQFETLKRYSPTKPKGLFGFDTSKLISDIKYKISVQKARFKSGVDFLYFGDKGLKIIEKQPRFKTKSLTPSYKTTEPLFTFTLDKTKPISSSIVEDLTKPVKRIYTFKDFETPKVDTKALITKSGTQQLQQILKPVVLPKSVKNILSSSLFSSFEKGIEGGMSYQMQKGSLFQLTGLSILDKQQKRIINKQFQALKLEQPKQVLQLTRKQQKERQGFLFKQRKGQGQLYAQPQLQIFVQKYRQPQPSLSRQLYAQPQLFAQRQKYREVYKTPQKTIQTTEKISRLTPEFKLITPKLSGGFYGVSVRRRGKFRTIGIFGSYRKAFETGLFRTRTTLARSFRVSGVPRTAQLPKDFYISRREPLTFIEKRRYALNVLGEKKSLRSYRRIKTPSLKNIFATPKRKIKRRTKRNGKN